MLHLLKVLLSTLHLPVLDSSSEAALCTAECVPRRHYQRPAVCLTQRSSRDWLTCFSQLSESHMISMKILTGAHAALWPSGATQLVSMSTGSQRVLLRRLLPSE